MKLLRKLRMLFQREKLDAEMAEEMREHIARRTQANLAAGLPPEEARDAARRQFGGVDQLKELSREQRGTLWFEHLMRDLRYAGRQLSKTPGFTAIAILTLALAIGVNSAVFALVNAVLLRPAVAMHPEEVVNLFTGRQGAVRDFRLFSHDEYRALRSEKETFAEVAATFMASAGISESGRVRPSRAFFTSENYFEMLGLRPAAGRFYNADECRPNANLPVIVVSYDLWQQFGGGGDFVGTTLTVNDRPLTVIGVAPKGFNGLTVLFGVDLWVPLGLAGEFSASSRHDLSLAENHALYLTARLVPGVPRAALAGRLPMLGQRLTAMQADAREGERTLEAEPPSRANISSQPSGREATVPVAIGLFSMAGCVLLIACLNLANMLLARGAGRGREIALRLALGANRSRIIRQLLAEGWVLAGAGAACGLLIAVGGNTLLARSFEVIVRLNGESFVLDVQPDVRVLGVTLLLGLAATLVFSFGPALRVSRADLLSGLKQPDLRETTGRFERFFSLRHVLVMGQLALSLALLFSAALFFRGALQAAQVSPGFDPSGVVIADLNYSLSQLRSDEAKRSLFTALDGIAEQPGVESSAAANFAPYTSRSEGRRVFPADEPVGSETAPAAGSRYADVTYVAVTNGYFDAVGARVVRGRDFTAAEARSDSVLPVAIVDETLARKFYPDRDALGQRIRLGTLEREIVGICQPHRHNARRPDFPPRVFVPYAAAHSGNVALVVRYATRDDAATTAAMGALRGLLREARFNLPVVQLAPLSRLVEQDVNVWLVRVGAILFGLFGVIALVLAIVGVYGVKAYAVARRTREIGIRIAVGALPRDIFALLIKQGALQIAVGLGAGLLLSLGAGKILTQLLYRVSPGDPLALAAAAGLLAATALLACWVPARRATRVDPVVALRSE